MDDKHTSGLCSVEAAVVPPTGSVSLADKQLPLFSRLQEINAMTPCCVTRAWESEGAKETNVDIKRPSHDAWGIKKVVFVFCDDFLLKVLDCPWAHDPEWASLLQSIYASVGTTAERVVRSLLASMPPGMSIPVHHDTGLWVKHCHRIHVPIVTGEAVDFLAGPTEDHLSRYLFDEGRVVELNNQAKHAVNNRLSFRRIHLIFDYVEECFPLNRYRLSPGQRLNQTRRTIDFAEDCGSSEWMRHRGVRFIIIGSQKSGTTSLYEYIHQHPMVVRGKRRETHNFDWRWMSKFADPSTTQLDHYLKYFDYDTLFKYPSLVSGESTPSYLLHSDLVIPRLMATAPWVKILVMLRNPTDRAYSQYHMHLEMALAAENGGDPVRGGSLFKDMSFEEAVQKDLVEIEKFGINCETSSNDKSWCNFLSARAQYNHGGHSLIARGLYLLQLEPWMQSFPHLRIFGLEADMSSKQKETVQSTMTCVFEYLQLPPHDLESVEAKNTRNYEPMKDNTRQLLNEFYRPFNERLFTALGRRLW